MVKKNRTVKINFILLIIINVFLACTIFSLMTNAQRLLDSDIKTSLTEIVSQNKDMINANLNKEMNKIALVAEHLAERHSQYNESLEDSFISYATEKNESQLFLGMPDGRGILPDGRLIDITGRNYIKITLDGSSNISDRLTSRATGLVIFVLSTPITVDDIVIGTVQKQFSVEQMYKIYASSLYEDQGYNFIINNDGYIIISSMDENFSPQSDNLIRLLFADNPEQTRQMKSDLATNTTGFMEINFRGDDVFAIYTPLENIYGWYLVSSVKTNALLPNVRTVIKIFYSVLLVLLAIFLLSSAYFLYSRNAKEKQLMRVAFVDPVTGLDTFAKFQFDLHRILKNNSFQKFYIFTFDIDNFKYINNYYGYPVGDKILSTLHLLYSQSKLPNELCARVYSDHFVMLLSDVSESRLRNLFNSEITIDDIILYLSAGLYEITNKNENVSLMVDKANMASKGSKGTHYKAIQRYSDKLDKQLIHNELAKRAIEQAILNDEITPYFQPKVNIHTLKLEGAEALARWIKKDGTVIAPGEFIPLSEKTGLIRAIDMVIFEKTLAFLRSNIESNIECVPISVNFSRVHLIDVEFVHTILSILEKYKVPTHLIEIELTETVIFENHQIIEELILHLHTHGIKISMDDFGSGYSSLNMLKDIDVDVIKFDRGFLQDSKNNERQKIILSAITRMANELQIKIVVEGVETQENVDLMKEYGCDIAQGYFFSRPLPIDTFSIIYKNGKMPT